jgi:hypothetical protein
LLSRKNAKDRSFWQWQKTFGGEDEGLPWEDHDVVKDKVITVMDLIWRSTNFNQHHRLGGIAVWKCRKSCRADSRFGCKGLTWGLDLINVYNRFELRFLEDDSNADRLINEVLKLSDLPPLAVMGDIWEDGVTSYLDEEGPLESRCQHGLPPKRPRELTWWAGMSGAIRRPSDEERERRKLLGEELDRLTDGLAAFEII